MALPLTQRPRTSRTFSAPPCTVSLSPASSVLQDLTSPSAPPRISWKSYPSMCPTQVSVLPGALLTGTTLITAHRPGAWQPSSQIDPDGQIRPGDNSLQCCDRTSPYGGHSLHTLVPIPYGNLNQEENLFG